MSAKAYAVSTGFEKKDKLISWAAKFVTFESGIIIGAAILLLSFLVGMIILFKWYSAGYPEMQETNLVIFILTLGVIGVQTIFSAVFLSTLLVERK
jgi:hypothetical protein